MPSPIPPRRRLGVLLLASLAALTLGAASTRVTTPAAPPAASNAAANNATLAPTHPGGEDEGPDVTPSVDAPYAYPKSSDPWDVNVPHAPHDTLRFETSEGTWMTVDVSPDGKTLVFDLLGDLYTMPIAGGHATRLTSGMAWDMQPRWSPDGKRIAFSSDRGGTENAWMMNANGTDPRPVSQEPDRFSNSPAWSPDGQWIVVRRRITDRSSLGTVELWMYSVLGGKGVQITKKAEWGDANEPFFSRDGRYVYFSGRRERFQYDRNPYPGIWQIRRFDRVTGKISTVTDGAGGSGRASFSPDGKTMSLIRRVREKTVLFVRDAESGRERKLWDGLSFDNMEGFAWTGVYPNYGWTPDGKSIVIYAFGGFWHVDVASGHASKIPFTASVQTIVTHAIKFKQKMDPDSIQVHQIGWPSTSPDGKTIAFSALGQLWTYPIAGGRAHSLTPPGSRAFAPAWSPDGKSLAYVSWKDSVGGDVMRISAGGGSPARVTRVSSQYSNPAWSRDGSRLVFLRGTGGPLDDGRNTNDEIAWDLQWIEAKGGEAHTVLTIDGEGDAPSMPHPVFNAAGDRIYYVDYGDDPTGFAQKNTLVSVKLDGTDRIEHANVTNGEDMIPSPDERWVAYRVKYSAYVAELPKAGREPVDLSPDGPLPARKLSDDSGDWLNWSRNGHAITWSSGPLYRSMSLDSLTAYWERTLIDKGQLKDKKPKPDAGKGADSSATGKGVDKNAEKKSDKKDEIAAPKPDSIVIHLMVARSRPHGTVAFTGARVITMRGGDRDEVLDDATVVVTDDHITAVGPRSSVTIPKGAKVMDASGKTIMPGLVDVHAHMHYASAGVVPDKFWAYEALLAYGVTTTHDPSATSWEVFTEGEMVQAGYLRGPRIYSTGNIIYGAGGRDALPITSLDEARNQIRRMKRLGAISIKNYMQPRRESRQWILQAAREESLLVVPEGGGKFEEDIGYVMDGHTGLEHSLPITPIYNDVIQVFSKSHSGWTPTLLVDYGGLFGEDYFYQHYDVYNDPKLLRFTPQRYVDARAIRRTMAPDWDWHHIAVAQGCKKVLEAGGHVQIGAHGQRQGLGDHWETWALVQGGMTPLEAIQCATWNGAWYLGMDGAIGSIEPGKLADFVVMDKNPIDDIHNTNTIRWTVKNGEVYDANTMKRER